MSRPNPADQQPVSFKTVPGRNRTQKWQQAKTYNYDGDEWGGYDPYDEYGGYDHEEPQPPMPPYAQQQGRPQRQNSFDQGDERRQFSGPQYGAPPGSERGISPAVSNGGSEGRPSGDYSKGMRGSSDYDRRARNFTNPEQVPPPLNMRSSPAPPPPAASDAAYPPRKSSISRGSSAGSPAPEPAQATSPSNKNADRPLPFIRPSDIYKRMAEEKERERQSMDSSRPSLDSIQRDASSPPGALAPARGTDSPASSVGAGRRPSLEPVMEHKEPLPASALPSVNEAAPPAFARTKSEVQDVQSQPEYRPLSSLQQEREFGEPAAKSGSDDPSPRLPPVSRFSGFGSEFIHGASSDSPSTATEVEEKTPTSPRDHVQSTIARVMNAPLVGSSVPTEQTPTTTTAYASADQAADILAERQHSTPISAIGRTSDLQHAPSTSSTGFRSVVNTAFDRKDDGSVPATPLSRDGSNSLGSGAGVARSDTTSSTAGISPIMSRVPSAATAQARQQERDQQVPPIAEEPASARTPTQSRPASDAYGMLGGAASGQQHVIPRKPSPGHSRNVSAESAASGVQRGYRRSLDPPSQDNSPARTPALEGGTDDRRLSTPMAAETVVAPGEEPDVEDQAAEVPGAHLEPAETPMSEVDELRQSTERDHMGLPTTTRGRSDTDYSTREADLASTVNASPNQPSYSPPVAEASSATQQLFLRTHNNGTSSSPVGSPGFARPVSPGIAAQGLGIARSGTPGSMTGRDSPAKIGRVREIAGNYNTLDEASRRSSVASTKSSWSNFRGSEENLSLKRKGTGGSVLADESEGIFPQYGQSQDRSVTPSADAGSSLAAPPGVDRDGVQSQASFRPHLPGEWVSYAPTPANEEPPPAETVLGDETSHEPPHVSTPRASRIDGTSETEPIDLTPTTKKSPLPHSETFAPDNTTSDQSPTSALAQVRDAGAALGASLMATAGLTSQARNFGSSDPAPKVEQPEMADKVPYGEVSSYAQRPVLEREESGATDVTDAPVSTLSEMPPTPPEKDTPLPGNHEGDAGERGLGSDLNAGPGGRPISNYFSGAIPPLRTGHSKETSREDGQQRPVVLPTLSTDTGMEDLESDRLRKEIVRSLDPLKKEEIKRESILEDAERTQDALDAPENERRIEKGAPALPAAEAQAPPQLMLNQRFSWENRPQAKGLLSSSTPTTPAKKNVEPEPEPLSPDIKPERPWERPRSRGLHIMNADAKDFSDEEEEEEEEEREKAVAVREPEAAEDGLAKSLPVGAAGAVGAAGFAGGLSAGVSPLVSPISKRSDQDADGHEGLQELAPSPIVDDEGRLESVDSGSARLPSYYQSEEAAGQSPIPEPPVKDTSTPTTPSAKRTSTGRVPPFREILAIKSSPERIQAYNDTRQTFAAMDTGLKAWLSGMLAQNPEHANINLSTSTKPLQNSGTFKHKASPSIIKFTKQFAGSTQESGSGGGSRRPSGTGAGVGGEASGRERVGGQIDTERMQQRGKDLMKSAGVLGGKAQAGAKGLFQRGKSRFGRDKQAPTSSYARSVPAPVSVPNASRSLAPPPSSTPPVLQSSTDLQDTPLSSRTNTSPVLPASQSKSPLPPPRSHTPSSTSTSGGPLSQAFSRLRERSRSKSTTRLKSRPTSLVISNPDLFVNNDSSAATSRSALTQPDATAGTENVSVPGPLALPRRTETWNEPGAEIPPSQPQSALRSGTATPSRLGVLPIPGPETFTEAGVFGSPERSIGGVEIAEHCGKDAILDTDTGIKQVTSATPDAVGTGDVPPEATGEQSMPAVASATQVGADLPNSRPQTAQRPSAQVSLPSQQRIRSPESPMTPTTPRALQQPTARKDDELYDSTPIAPKAMNVWPVNQGAGASEDPPSASSGAEDEEETRPSTADTVDHRSLVSAEDVNDDGQQEEAGKSEIESRRSSVSSLGAPAAATDDQAGRDDGARRSNATTPQMSAQAVPAGPVPMMQSSRGGTPVMTEQTASPPVQRSLSTYIPGSDQQRFISRSYWGRTAPASRTMSYQPMGFDRSGMPLQETLNTEREDETVPVDLTGFSGPPTGTPPFQQHPVFRNSQLTEPSEYAALRSSGAQEAALTGPTEQADRLSKRYSRTPDDAGPAASSMSNIPPPHAMTPSYGLEDLDTTSTTAVSAPPADKASKRRSGLWEAFKRSPSVSKTDFNQVSTSGPVESWPDLSSEASFVQLPRRTEPEAPPKQKTLKKPPQRAVSAAAPPQRAVSAAAPPTEEKKRRFPGLASLFGRSSTQGRSTPKPNKLTKQQPPSRESSTARLSTVAPGVSGSYDAYEAARQRQIPDLQGRPQQPEMSGGIPAPFNVVDADAPGSSVPRAMPQASPPPQGWYGPSSPSTIDQPQRQSYAQPPPYRRLHSESFQRGLQHANIPEAFRPTEASYGRQAASIGPPPEQQPLMVDRPPSRTYAMSPVSRQPSGASTFSGFDQAYSPPPLPPQRQVSNSSAGSYFPSGPPAVRSPPPQSDYGAPQPPIGYGRGVLSPAHQQRNDSMRPAWAASPTQEYGPPRNAGPLPPAGGYQFYPQQAPPRSTMSPFVSSHGHPPPQAPWSRAGGEDYPLRSSPHAQQYQGERPMYPDSRPSSQAFVQSPIRSPPPHTQHSRLYDPRAMSGSPPGWQAQQRQAQQPMPYYPQGPPQQQRYYSQPQSPESRPLTYRRAASGFSGRRDDATVSEETLMGMRGASYPGQEWSPVEGHGGSFR